MRREVITRVGFLFTLNKPVILFLVSRHYLSKWWFSAFLKIMLYIELSDSDILRLPGCSFVQVHSLFLRDMWGRVF